MTLDGWDRLIHLGAFMVFDMDYWFSAPVQDFLQLAVATGADVEQRWQEQVSGLVR
jgi:hypothetical protein